ncbi:MAG TPA: glycosyltransferase family 4 protein [Chloroflexota bacterium]|nr:glycosyltransferase family 4 protein [Chloroflexota bacterium]
MKVAHVNYSYGQRGSSGTEQTVPATCALLEAEGLATCVLYEQAVGPPPPAPGRALYHIPGLCSFALRPNRTAIARALAALERERVDLVHLHQINNGSLVRAIAARWPTLYFVHNHVLTCPSGTRFLPRSGRVCPQLGPGLACVRNAYLEGCQSRRPGRWVRGLLDCHTARAFARGLTLAVDSEFMKRTLVAAGYAPERITVTPTVVEPTPRPPDYYPAHQPPRVLYVGQLNPIKGLPRLLAALRQLTTPAVLHVAGDGYLRPALERQVVALGLRDRVVFHGHVDRVQLVALLRECAVLAVPTCYPEPFGLVGPEAMAQARPVVAFDIGAIREWLRDGQTGLLARPGDVGDLAAKLDYLLQHPAEARRLGQAGRQVWEERFHPRHHLAALLRLYRTLTARAEPAPILEAAACE